MNCPKCNAKIGLNDRICPGCKFMAEAQRVVATIPPRARRPKAPPRRASTWLLHHLSRERAKARPKRPAVRHTVKVAAAVIPGLGHTLDKQDGAALVYATLIPAVFWIAFYFISHGANQIGQYVMGIAAAIHAYSIFTLTHWNLRSDPWVRLSAMALTLTILHMGIYWTLTERLNRTVGGVASSRLAQTNVFGMDLTIVDRFAGTFWLLLAVFGTLLLSWGAAHAAKGAQSLILRWRRKPT